MSLAVGLIRAAVCLEGALAHNALADNQRRLALHLLGCLDGAANLGGVISIDLEHLPTEGAVLGCGILVEDFLGLGRELDVVGVVEHNEVVEAQNRSDACATLADLFLDTAIRDVCVDGLLLERRVACVSCKELCCDSGAYCENVALSERT